MYSAQAQEDQLRALLRKLPDSPGVMRISCQITGYPNFFPGGKGFKGSSFPKSPVMLIGHNFDTDEGFRDSVQRGHEDPEMKTWLNLQRHFLQTARIEESDCFFTNFYLGAVVHPEPEPGKRRKTKNTGRFSCSRDYHRACVDALRKQVEIVRPKLIGLLGAMVPPAFAEAFPVYQPFLGKTLRETQSKQPKNGLLLQLLPDLQIRIVSLAHPSNPRSTESHCVQGLFLKACAHDSVLDQQMTAAKHITTMRQGVLKALASY